MERKSRVLLFSTLILGLFLVSLYLSSAAHTFTSKDSSLNTSNEGRGLTKDVNKNFSNLQSWTLFNATEIFNFTINASGANEVYRIDIIAPSGIAYNITNAPVNFANVTNNGTDFNWTFTNSSYTPNVTFQIIGGRSSINMTGNITTVWVNYTALFVGETVFTWNVTTRDVLNATSSQLYTTGIDASAPRADANTTNLTQSHSALPLARTANFDATTYLRNDTEINITFTVTDYNLWKVLLLYNNSGGTVNLTNISNGQQYNEINLSGDNGVVARHAGDNADFLVMKDMVTNSPNVTSESTKGQTPAAAPSYVFRATLSMGNFSSDGTPVTFAFVVFDLYNQSAQVNNSNAVFRFVEDGLAPSVSVTEPDDKSISTSSSAGIKYICAGSDSNNTIASYSWTLTKPGGEKVTKTTATATFSLTDVDKAGTYDLKCTVTDQVGNDATSSNYQFTAHVTSSSGSGGSPSGGSGTGTATQPKVENDLSVSEVVTITKQQGRIVSFSLDGQNVHKMTFKEVTASKVTLVLESTPVEVTLEIGESKKVDLDGDGTGDVEVTLVSIKNGLAEITTKKLATPVSDTTTTTTLRAVTTTLPAAQPGAAAGAAGSKAWLWILLIVVVIAVVVYFVKKKKRR